MEWEAMLALGAYHGINPGMGWLFAVALGMQQRSVRGVWRALPPIALGHAAAVGVVVAAAALAGVVVPMQVLKAIIATMLITLGSYRLWRHRHPRFGGMQVNFRDLTMWSFLMAFAHGAGLMLMPWVMTMPADVSAASAAFAAPSLAGDGGSVGHAGHMMSMGTAPAWIGVLAVGVHTASYLGVMTLAALFVYRRLGLAFLRAAWLNLDWVWAGALVVTGIAVLLR